MGTPNLQPDFDAPATYDAAADDYARAARRYWGSLGERTVERLAPEPGSRVLDVACGTGSSLLPAARLVGASGRVIGVDLADRMLAITQAEVDRLELRNVELRLADMTRLPFPDASFDVVLCVLGLFFVPDMSAQVAELWRLVRPGGRLAITTLGPAFLSPMYHAWAEAAAAERPDLDLRPPWQRTDDPEVLRTVLAAGGLAHCELALESRRLPLPSAEAWWPVVLGTGLRRFVQSLGPDAADRVRAHNEAWARARQVDSLTVDAIYAVASKPDAGS